MANFHINRPPCAWQSPSLYVGDLEPGVNEADLSEVFAKFGDIESIKVCKNWTTGAPLGYGFVNFRSIEAAKQALESYNYCPINGKPCRLMWSTKRSIGSTKESEAANIYVKGLPKSLKNKDLHKMFSACGVVLSAKVATNGSGVSLGYGYVSFTKEEYAVKAMREMHKTKIGEMILSVEPFVQKEKRSGKPKTTVYVGSIPFNWTEETLWCRFGLYGQVKSIEMCRDSFGLATGYGFITFENSQSARLAVQDNQSFLPNSLGIDPVFTHALEVKFGTKKELPALVSGNVHSEMQARCQSGMSQGAGSESSVEAAYLDFGQDLLGWNAFDREIGASRLKRAGFSDGMTSDTTTSDIRSLVEEISLLDKAPTTSTNQLPNKNIFEFIECTEN